MREVNRILVTRTDRLGDVIMALPALVSVRERAAGRGRLFGPVAVSRPFDPFSRA